MGLFRPVFHSCLQLLIRITEEELGYFDRRLDVFVQTIIERHVNAVARGSLVALGAGYAIEIDGTGVLSFGIAVEADVQVVEKLLQYSWSLPVAAAVLGMPTHEMIRQNAQFARNFAPMPEDEMRDFSHRMAGANKMALDLRFRNHLDC